MSAIERGARVARKDALAMREYPPVHVVSVQVGSRVRLACGRKLWQPVLLLDRATQVTCSACADAISRKADLR